MTTYDPFGVYGQGGATTTATPVPKNYTGGTNAKGTKGTAGRTYDPFNIGSIQSQPAATVSAPNQITTQPKQKSQSLFGKIGNFVKKDVVEPTVTTSEKALNTAGAGVAGVAGLTKIGAEKAIGNDAGAQKTAANTTRVIDEKLTKGAGGKGGYLTPQQAESSGGGKKGFMNNFVKPTAQATADIAPLVVPLGKGAEGASIGARVLSSGAKNAAVGGGATVANEAINGQLTKDNGGQILKGVAQGAALGAAGELLHTGVKASKEAVSTKGTKELVKNVQTKNALEKLAEKQNTKHADVAVADLPTLDTSYLDAKPVQTVASTTRAPETIKEDIKTNADHIKTITGKSPSSFFETSPKGNSTKMIEEAPKEVKPYLEKHQELQKEYVQVTSPKADTVTPVSAEPKLVSDGTPIESATTTTENRGTGKIAQDIQTQAVKRGLKNDFGEAAGYDKLTIADQTQKAVALTNDRPALDKVISGESPLPDGLRATALIKAVENHPVLGKDPEIIRRLSQAEHLTGESSRSAQELRLAAERNPHSPVEVARTIKQAREAAFEKKTGKSAATQVNREVRIAQASKPKITKQTWSEFIDSIKC